MNLPAGTRLGPYELIAPIGAGGMGEVYRARDTRLNRDVAIKVLPSSFAPDQERLRRFTLEAQSTGALNHPHILAIYDLGTHEGLPYLVTELLEGESLRERLKRGKLGVPKSIDYARQIADGLGAAHAKGIIHRDIKPENLFVTKDGRLKILDFGLAKVTSPLPAAKNGTLSLETSPGAVLGTVAYMSPEQVRGLAVDHRSDIFSFGCVLYEMLSGQRAFGGPTPADTMSAILNENPPELASFESALPPALDRMVRHCLEKNPEERFQSARDLTFALESLSQISQTGRAGTPAFTQPVRRGWMKWLVAVAMILLFVAGIFLGLHWVKPSELKFHRLTFRRGRIHAARFAPDGNTIVYSAAWEEEPIQIFAIRGVGPESLPLGFQGAGLFGISSKGELAIGLNLLPITTFVSEGTLARAPFSGGAPRPILEKIRFADWSPNGGELAVVRETEKGYQIEFPIGKVLCQGPSGGYISDLRISPDGLHIAFIEHPTSSSDGYVALVDLTGQKRTLTSHFAGDARGLAWSAKGDEIWFTAAKGGARNELLSVTLSGRDRLLSSQVAQLVLQDISRDGRVLFIANMDYRTKILFRGTGDSRERELSWMDWSQVRDISHDGKQITFDESGEGARDEPSCYLRETNGSAAVKLGPGFAPVLSPDGQSVLAVDQTASGIIVFPVGPGEIKYINLKGFVIERVFWLPNGREVLIGANEAGHGSRIYRMPLEGGTPRAITPEGVSLTRTGVSPDGKYIPGARASSDKMLLYPLEGGEPQVAEGVLPGEWIANWSADGTALFAYRRNETPVKVYRVDRRSGRRELVQQITPADLAGVNVASTIKMTPDGKSYAYSISQMLGELHMVEGLK